MPEVKEWLFDPKEILASNRKVKGIFHKSVIDKDDELITPDAIKKSIPDYMHLPALHDFHKERPVGLATRIWQEKDGSFGFEGVIKATEDCDDIWEKISKGNYDHVSIFGRRTEGNQNCSLPQGLRTGPCITNGVRLDSISVCDDNARNDSTSLSVKKAQLIWDGMDMIQKSKTVGFGTHPYEQSEKRYATKKEEAEGWKDYNKKKEEKKAETAGESGLMHTATDNPEKKCPCSKKKYKVIEKSEDVEKSTSHENVRPRTTSVKLGHSKLITREVGENRVTYDRDGKPIRKGDDMDVEKGGWEKSMNETEALHKKTQRPEQRKLNEKKKKTAPEGLKLQKGEEDDEMTDDVEKGQWGEDTAEIHSHDIRHRGKTTSGTQKRTEGKESSMKETDTTATSKPSPKKEKPREKTSGVKYDKMEKADDDDEQEIDTETRGEDAKEEMDEEDVEKGRWDRTPRRGTGSTPHERAKQGEDLGSKIGNRRTREALTSKRGGGSEQERNRGARGLGHMTKSGEQMEEDEEVSQEYVTKAMVPIEEVDTIVKARTEEISKAYIAQFDEIKKANLAAIDEIKKAYDAKFAELNTKVDKMAEETIRKGGSIVVIPQLLDPTSQTGSMSNADALARMTVGR